MICIYANPLPTGKNKTGYVAGVYVYPYFHQNWNLFVPAPTSNYTLFARSAADSVTTDVFKEIVLKHQSNRLWGYEPLVIALSNSIHYFEKNTAFQQAMNGPIRGDLYFDIVEHTVKKYLQHTRKNKVDKVKLILVVEDVINKHRRVYFN